MNSDDNGYWIGLACGIAIGFLCCFVTGKAVSVGIRADAARAGAAEWRVDPKTGATEFVWLSPPKDEDQGQSAAKAALSPAGAAGKE